MRKMTISAPASVQRKWTTGKRAKLKLNSIRDTGVRSTTMLVLENIDRNAATDSTMSLVEESGISMGSFQTPGSVGGGRNFDQFGNVGNTAMYHPVSMALARRVLPSLFAHKLVGVQPMNAPVGVAFAMRNIYQNTDGTQGNAYEPSNEAAWKSIGEHAGFSGGYAAAKPTTYTAKNPESVGADITIEVATKPTLGGAANWDATAGAQILNYATANADLYALAMEAWGVGYTKWIETAGTAATWPGANAEEGARGVSTAAAELLGIQGDDAQIFGAAPTAANKMNEIGVVFDKKLIEATERRLAASFSLEAMQDIKALHNLDLKMEVLEILQYETTAELDRELLNAIKTCAIDTANGGGSVLEVVVGGTMDNRQATSIIVNAILLAANIVAKQTKRGRANFVVVSPTVGSVLQSAVPFFTSNEAKIDPGIVLSGAESTEIGKINGVLTVYLDQFATTDYALVGYKGGAVAAYDSGVIFCPYTMNVVNEAVAQENFKPRIGVMSRYAIATNLLSAGNYYRAISFQGLADVFGGANFAELIGW